MKRMASLFIVWLMLPLAISAGAVSAPASPPASTALAGAESPAAPPLGVAANWWSAVQENLKRSEYQASRQEKSVLPELSGVWQAPNRAQNFRTYFTPEGVWVVPRTAAATPEWVWGMSLIGAGAPGQPGKVEPARIEVNGNRVEYCRGALTEWYVNDERGLEQGFTVHEPPAADETTDVELVLRLEVRGTLDGRLVQAGTAIHFAPGGSGAVLRYAGLRTLDATGRELSSKFRLTPGVLEIVVATAGARYPIEIDPLASSPHWTAESDQAYASFGLSVGTAGDVNGDGYADVIVGAPNYDNGLVSEGRAFVFHGSADGLISQPAWTAESNQAAAGFGYSVSTAGDVNGDGYADVIVGAPFYDYAQYNEGRAFVYHGSADGLGSEPAWTAESNQEGAGLGLSVGTAGDVNGDGYADVIVGAPVYDNGETDEGRAFVFLGLAGGLATSPAWTAESDYAGAQFGSSVGTAGDVNGDGYADVIVGAPGYANSQTAEGRAFVFHGAVDGLRTAHDWIAEPNLANAHFGRSVAAAGDVNGDGYADVIVGAPDYDNGLPHEGRAFVFHGSADGLISAPAWTAESNQAGAGFGLSVGTAGDVNGDGYADVVVGAPFYDNGQNNEGRAFVYHGSAAGLGTTQKWSAESDQADAWFGHSVGTAGDVNGDGYADVIVGAYGFDNGETDEGRAYVFLGSASGPSANSNWSADSDQVSAFFGWSVGTAGDVNGDGYADVIVGALLYDNGQNDEGRAFVFLGSADGLGASPIWTAESDQEGAKFGRAVGTAGDVNGDGFADVIVGAYGFDSGVTDVGRAYVFLGSAAGLGASPIWTAESDQEGAAFGWSVGTAGDVNGDGFADVIVGARAFENGEDNEGRAYVFLGSADGLGASPIWTAESDQEGAAFGYSVGTAGDVNGDGFADVIVGAPYYDSGQDNEGRAYVFHGSASGLSTTSHWSAESNQVGGLFGSSVGTAGDVNGDGYADVIVGAPYFNSGQDDEGVAFLFHGSALGILLVHNWWAQSNQAGAQLGFSVGTAGDVNGDGYADVVVGAHLFDTSETDGGRAYVFLGSAAGLSTTPNWIDESNQPEVRFGYSVGTAGDVNGDGYADVIVGAPNYNLGELQEGRTFLYFGNGGAGLSLRPRQRRADDSAPIAHLGSSKGLDRFRLALLGRTPFGRGKVKLQWEVKPLGTPFEGTGTGQSASWTDTGTAGAAFTQLIGSLSPSTVYHWRVRLLYHPATTPFRSFSRWLTQPWNGWQEADFTTSYRSGAGLPFLFLLLDE